MDSTLAERLLSTLQKTVLDTNTTPAFTSCRGSWGYKGGRIYYDHLTTFTRSLKTIALNSGIKYYNGKYFFFNGKIYEPVDKECLKFVYTSFVDWLDIPVMMNDTKYYRLHFLDVIMVFCELKPRFDVVAFDNGVLDLKDYTFHKFSPDYHCLDIHNYRYNPKAECPMWQAFLKEVLPDKASRVILQMFLSLGITERTTVKDGYKGDNPYNIELCLLLVGAGANGKSVIYNTAMGIFGRERISGADYDELTSLGDEGMRARRLLRGCLFNWSSDSDVRQFGKRTGVFKKIVSGEPITDRAIGGDVEQNFHMPYLIFNLNELPSSSDKSLGFVRRLQYISFENIIPVEKQNKHLSKDLMREYPGIFNWIVRGAKELKRRKYQFPDSEGSYRMLLKTMVKTNPVHAWISAYKVRPCAKVDRELSVFIPASKILESINDFAELNGVEPVSIQLLGATMNQHGFFKKRRSDGVLYQVFGCTEEIIEKPFCIEDAEIKMEYIPEKGTFIEDRD